MTEQVTRQATGSAKQVPMRERIIAAAIDVIAERGIAAATTKEIARAAGASEGSLYNHFANKTALIGAAMGELAGGLREAMVALLERVGAATIEENLATVALAAIDFYRRILPINGPVLGDPEVLAQIRRDTPEIGVGPLRGHQALTGYIAAEQKAGRVAASARPVYLASALIGACHQYAFLGLMADSAQIEAAGLPSDAEEYAREVARLVSQAAATSSG
jgi:AcrR family transcriptional regulator